MSQGAPIRTALASAGKIISSVLSSAAESTSSIGHSGDWTSALVSSLSTTWTSVATVFAREGNNLGNIFSKGYVSVIDNFSSSPELIKEFYEWISPYLKDWSEIKSKSEEGWKKKQEIGKLLLKLFEHRSFITEISKTVKILNSSSNSSNSSGNFSDVIDNFLTILDKSSSDLEKIFRELVKSEVKSKLILKIAGNGMTGLKKVVTDWDRKYSALFR